MKNVRNEIIVDTGPFTESHDVLATSIVQRTNSDRVDYRHSVVCEPSSSLIILNKTPYNINVVDNLGIAREYLGLNSNYSNTPVIDPCVKIIKTYTFGTVTTLLSYYLNLRSMEAMDEYLDEIQTIMLNACAELVSDHEKNTDKPWSPVTVNIERKYTLDDLFPDVYDNGVMNRITKEGRSVIIHNQKFGTCIYAGLTDNTVRYPELMYKDAYLRGEEVELSGFGTEIYIIDNEDEIGVYYIMSYTGVVSIPILKVPSLKSGLYIEETINGSTKHRCYSIADAKTKLRIDKHPQTVKDLNDPSLTKAATEAHINECKRDSVSEKREAEREAQEAERVKRERDEEFQYQKRMHEERMAYEKAEAERAKRRYEEDLVRIKLEADLEKSKHDEKMYKEKLQAEQAKRKHEEQLVKEKLQAEKAKRAHDEQLAKEKLQAEKAKRKHEEEIASVKKDATFWETTAKVVTATVAIAGVAAKIYTSSE